MLIAALGLAVAGGAQAFWFPPIIFDAKHSIENIARQIENSINQLKQWATGPFSQQIRDANKLRQLIKDYESTLNTVRSLQAALTLPNGAPLSPVDENTHLVEANCGEQGGGGVAGLIGSLTGLDLRGNVFAQQYDLCVKMQRMRNRQYNEMVTYLSTTVNSMQQMNNELTSVLSTARNSGDVMGATANALSASRKQAMANSEFETRMTAYNAYYQTQKQNQGSLAKGAMRGQPGLLRTVVDAAAMRTALCAGGRCN